MATFADSLSDDEIRAYASKYGRDKTLALLDLPDDSDDDTIRTTLGVQAAKQEEGWTDRIAPALGHATVSTLASPIAALTANPYVDERPKSLEEIQAQQASDFPELANLPKPGRGGLWAKMFHNATPGRLGELVAGAVQQQKQEAYDVGKAGESIAGSPLGRIAGMAVPVREAAFSGLMGADAGVVGPAVKGGVAKLAGLASNVLFPAAIETTGAGEWAAEKGSAAGQAAQEAVLAPKAGDIVDPETGLRYPSGAGEASLATLISPEVFGQLPQVGLMGGMAALGGGEKLGPEPPSTASAWDAVFRDKAVKPTDIIPEPAAKLSLVPEAELLAEVEALVGPKVAEGQVMKPQADLASIFGRKVDFPELPKSMQKEVEATGPKKLEEMMTLKRPFKGMTEAQMNDAMAMDAEAQANRIANPPEMIQEPTHTQDVGPEQLKKDLASSEVWLENLRARKASEDAKIQAANDKGTLLDPQVIEASKATIGEINAAALKSQRLRAAIELADIEKANADTLFAQKQAEAQNPSKKITLQSLTEADALRQAEATRGTLEGEPATRLPKHLQGAKPRYRDATPLFASDIDKALFVVAQESLSKSDSAYMQFLKDNLPLLNEKQIRQAGVELRKSMKTPYANKVGTSFAVPESGASVWTKTPREKIRLSQLPESSPAQEALPAPSALEDLPKRKLPPNMPKLEEVHPDYKKSKKTWIDVARESLERANARAYDMAQRVNRGLGAELEKPFEPMKITDEMVQQTAKEMAQEWVGDNTPDYSGTPTDMGYGKTPKELDTILKDIKLTDMANDHADRGGLMPLNDFVKKAGGVKWSSLKDSNRAGELQDMRGSLAGRNNKALAEAAKKEGRAYEPRELTALAEQAAEAGIIESNSVDLLIETLLDERIREKKLRQSDPAYWSAVRKSLKNRDPKRDFQYPFRPDTGHGDPGIQYMNSMGALGPELKRVAKEAPEGPKYPDAVLAPGMEANAATIREKAASNLKMFGGDGKVSGFLNALAGRLSILPPSSVMPWLSDNVINAADLKAKFDNKMSEIVGKTASLVEAGWAGLGNKMLTPEEVSELPKLVAADPHTGKTLILDANAYKEFITERPSRGISHHDLISMALEGVLPDKFLPEGSKKAVVVLRRLLDGIADIEGIPKHMRNKWYFPHVMTDSKIVRRLQAMKEFTEGTHWEMGDNGVVITDRALKKRIGATGWTLDWKKALASRIRSASRKVFMEAALKEARGVSDSLKKNGGLDNIERSKYIDDYVDMMEGRGSGLDRTIDMFAEAITPNKLYTALQALDNTKQMQWLRDNNIPVLGRYIEDLLPHRGGAKATSQAAANALYYSIMAFAVGTGFKNAFQIMNTVGYHGQKNTLKGIQAMFTKEGRARFAQSGAMDDFGNFAEGVTASKSMNKWWERIKKAPMSPMLASEYINRGVAYNAGLMDGLDKGMAPDAANRHALRGVRKTQFQYGQVENSPILNNSIGRIWRVLGTYPQRQAAFLHELATRPNDYNIGVNIKGKDGKVTRIKVNAGLARYIIYTGAVAAGALSLGMDVTDSVGGENVETEEFGTVPVPLVGTVKQGLGSFLLGDRPGQKALSILPETAIAAIQRDPVERASRMRDIKKDAATTLEQLIAGQLRVPLRAVKDVVNLNEELNTGQVKAQPGNLLSRLTQSSEERDKARAKYRIEPDEAWLKWAKLIPAPTQEHIKEQMARRKQKAERMKRNDSRRK